MNIKKAQAVEIMNELGLQSKEAEKVWRKDRLDILVAVKSCETLPEVEEKMKEFLTEAGHLNTPAQEGLDVLKSMGFSDDELAEVEEDMDYDSEFAEYENLEEKRNMENKFEDKMNMEMAEDNAELVLNKEMRHGEDARLADMEDTEVPESYLAYTDEALDEIDSKEEVSAEVIEKTEEVPVEEESSEKTEEVPVEEKEEIETVSGSKNHTFNAEKVEGLDDEYVQYIRDMEFESKEEVKSSLSALPTDEVINWAKALELEWKDDTCAGIVRMRVNMEIVNFYFPAKPAYKERKTAPKNQPSPWKEYSTEWLVNVVDNVFKLKRKAMQSKNDAIIRMWSIYALKQAGITPEVAESKLGEVSK